MKADLRGERVLVIGASSGIGRSMAQHAARCGAEVVFSARRRDRLEAAAAEVGGGHVVAGDVRDPKDCARIIDEAVRALGGIDLFVFATAYAPLVRMKDQTAEEWRKLFETNAIGAFLTVSAAIPHLSDHAAIAYLSSVGVGAPYVGSKAYTATKAALNDGMYGLRVENPDLRIVRIDVGDTMGTETAVDHDPKLRQQLMPDVQRYGLVMDRYLSVDTVGPTLIEQLGIILKHPDAWIERITIRPTGSPIPFGGDSESRIAEMLGTAAEDGAPAPLRKPS